MSVNGDSRTDSQSPENPHSWRIPRPFGTGVKRKQISFVPASTENQDDDGLHQTARESRPNHGSSVAEFYLSLVLPSEPGSANTSPPSSKSTHSSQFKGTSTSEAKLLHGPSSVMEISSRKARSMMPSRRDHATSKPCSSKGSRISSGSSDSLDTSEEAGIGDPARCLSEDAAVRPASAVVEHPIETPAVVVDEICSTCNSRLTNWESHVRTTAHMFSLEHSKPPHHLNRQSEGYKHMVKLGWGPDDCEGLGAEGQGIRFPVKATSKNDNLGIGAKPSKSIRDTDSVSDSNPKRPRLLTAKQMQRLEKAERAARQDLHDYLRH
ncbi:uncharacterized protein DFL_005903 [Arthrobotrys flagrans]|uniref:G-patch domain-containing protein n=1 Tax=Arthrobotrys flagrans TaxID=97331 RepID=A0A436ZYQ9_ARTFL|nr:hypothetical protein DFL_005903 [Arthrobotrys flagrans]